MKGRLEIGQNKWLALEHITEEGFQITEIHRCTEVEVGEMESDEGDITGELGPEDAGEDLGMEDEEDPMAALSEVEYLDEDVLMEKVYRRVTKRLAKEKRADDVATVLAEKLAARVAKKLR